MWECVCYKLVVRKIIEFCGFFWNVAKKENWVSETVADDQGGAGFGTVVSLYMFAQTQNWILVHRKVGVVSVQNTVRYGACAGLYCMESRRVI